MGSKESVGVGCRGSGTAVVIPCPVKSSGNQSHHCPKIPCEGDQEPSTGPDAWDLSTSHECKTPLCSTEGTHTHTHTSARLPPCSLFHNMHLTELRHEIKRKLTA